MRATRKPEAFTPQEIKLRHAYLVKLRQKALRRTIKQAEQRLQGLKREPRAWTLLTPRGNWRGFAFDADAAAAALGSEFVPGGDNPKEDAHEGVVDEFAVLGDVTRHPTRIGIRLSDAWLAAEAAAVANHALGAVELDEMQARDDQARAYAQALGGEAAALDEVHRERSAAGGRAGKGRYRVQHVPLFHRAAALLERRGDRPTPANVRKLMHEEKILRFDRDGPIVCKVWRILAEGQGANEPLSQIEDITVSRSPGVIHVDYKPPRKRRDVDDKALAAILRRRPKKRIAVKNRRNKQRLSVGVRMR